MVALRVGGVGGVGVAGQTIIIQFGDFRGYKGRCVTSSFMSWRCRCRARAASVAMWSWAERGGRDSEGADNERTGRLGKQQARLLCRASPRAMLASHPASSQPWRRSLGVPDRRTTLSCRRGASVLARMMEGAASSSSKRNLWAFAYQYCSTSTKRRRVACASYILRSLVSRLYRR